MNPLSNARSVKASGARHAHPPARRPIACPWTVPRRALPRHLWAGAAAVPWPDRRGRGGPPRRPRARPSQPPETVGPCVAHGASGLRKPRRPRRPSRLDITPSHLPDTTRCADRNPWPNSNPVPEPPKAPRRLEKRTRSCSKTRRLRRPGFNGLENLSRQHNGTHHPGQIALDSAPSSNYTRASPCTDFPDGRGLRNVDTVIHQGSRPVSESNI